MSIERGVIYFNRDKSHLIRLLISISSLRKYWNGPIAIVNEGRIYGAIEEACSTYDASLINVFENGYPTYSSKVSATRFSPFEKSMFIDLDTVVTGEIDKFFDFLDDTDFVFTKFPGWKTARDRLWGKLEEWLGKNIVSDSEINKAFHMPGINTGVFGFKKNHSMLEEWLRLTVLAEEMGLGATDESCAQILLNRFNHKLVGWSWNQSAKYAKKTEERIIHYHGASHLKEYGGKKRYRDIYQKTLDRVETENPNLFVSVGLRLKTKSTITCIVCVLETELTDAYQSMARMAISSLFRAGYNGRVIVIRNVPDPLFKSGKDSIESMFLPEYSAFGHKARKKLSRESIFNDAVSDSVMKDSSKWVMYMDADHVWNRSPETLLDDNNDVLVDGKLSTLGASMILMKKNAYVKFRKFYNSELGFDWMEASKLCKIKQIDEEKIAGGIERNITKGLRSDKIATHYGEKGLFLEEKVLEQYANYMKEYYGDATKVLLALFED